ncbi:cytochrome ubiquinol oxidase subunit I [Arthrobacter sp. B6]|uniref:cytochrome ubiquinol oxidase subunit I n=1 Tax=Arthrobacter sp. B6 TaxID=1570137 RepID=UPI0012E9615F
MPAITLLADWRGHRSGDPNYGLSARRWAKVMGVWLAVGAVSGTIQDTRLAPPVIRASDRCIGV